MLNHPIEWIFAIVGLGMVLPVTSISYAALNACGVQNRILPFRSLWWNVVPVVNLLWILVTIIGTSNSLRREFIERNIHRGGGYGRALGCWAFAFWIGGIYCLLPPHKPSRLPTCNITEYFLFSTVLWVIYIIRIQGFTTQLRQDNWRRFGESEHELGIQSFDRSGTNRFG
jgi:hypothetical protein